MRNFIKYIIVLTLCFFGITVFGQTYTLNAPPGGANYQWYTAGVSVTPIPGETNMSYVASMPGIYFAKFDNSSCGGATDYMVVVSGCGADAEYTLDLGSVPNSTIQWYADNVPVPNATTTALTITSDTTVHTYYASIIDAKMCDNSSPAFTVINLNPCVDTDGDGIDDLNDLDDDNDGIPDTVEIATAGPTGDSDGDGIPDHQDLDSDNDGINDINESGGTDLDGNGMIDSPFDEGMTTNPTDTDGDGIPDYQEVDSDNDGVMDIAGTPDSGLDTDGDGMIDDQTDTDRDGIKDPADGLPIVFGDAPRGPRISIHLWLEGPYDAATSLMSNNLSQSGLLPLTEPYTSLGYVHNGSGGGEIVNQSVLDKTGSESIADWVFLELRSATTNTNVLATRAALLRADGVITDIDGVSPVEFTGQPSGTYFVVIKHRNHLSVMTPTPIALTGGTAGTHDFAAGSAYGNLNGNAQTSLGTGVFGLFEGDYEADELISATDRSIAWNFRNQTGYIIQDSNFDGVCNASERSQVWNNRNNFSKVP